MLSLAARGGFLDQALADMRKVAWDRGPVRLGSYEKADGTLVPMWHDSEVAALAFAIQKIISDRVGMQKAAVAPKSESAVANINANRLMAGKKCPECGAHAVIKKDGCEHCTSCGHLGSCG